MGKNTVKIELLGTSFLITSNDGTDYLSKIVTLLEEKIGEVKNHMPFSDPLKIALLTSLNLVDELMKQKEKTTPLSDQEELEEVTERLIMMIDDSLENIRGLNNPQSQHTTSD